MGRNKLKKNEEKVDDNLSPQWTLWTAASYAIVMLVIGLPLWWKTTTVQRVPLPYHEMISLHQHFIDHLRIGIRVEFKGFTAQLDDAELKKHLGNEAYSLHYDYGSMSAEEMDIVYKSEDLDEIDVKLCSFVDNKNTDLRFYYVGRADLLKKFGHKVVLGNCRNAYYISNSAKIDMTLAEQVLHRFVSENNDCDSTCLKSATIGNSNSEQKESVQLPLSAGYDILLSLLMPQPEVLDCAWKIEKGVKDFIDPMLKKLSPLAEFTVRSQTLYYVKLNVEPKLNPKSGIYEIPYYQLPLVINPVESKLTSFVSQNPALNFIVYTAPCEEYPMQILDEEVIGLKSNAFLVPQWGGIQIYNAPCSRSVNATETVIKSETHEIAIEQVMAVVITQFRSLLGLPEVESRKDILDFNGSALRDWEVDIIVRKRLRNLLFTAANTIKSLGNLLDQITNIVVTEEVGRQVEESVQSLKMAFSTASLGDLRVAQEYAIQAFKASEIAFHHPTNLAQLYFPDDQKYAIYIPLFLPVGIPVLLSLKTIFQSLLGRKSKPKKD